MTISVVLFTAVLGAVVPLVTKFGVNVDANPVLKSFVAIVLAGLGAALAYGTNVAGPVDLKTAVGVAVTAMIAAGGLRVSSWIGDIEAWIGAHVPGGIGASRRVNPGQGKPQF